MPYIQVLLPIIHYRITTDQHYIVQFQEITIISSQFKKKRRLKQILPPALNSPVPIYTPGWREHNAMSPARSRTRTARSGVERTNHEATAPL